MAQVNNEIMKQLNNDENFLSGSKMAEQLSVDEAHWQQDRTYCMPVMSAEKQELDLTSFSGIIGQLDLTVEYVCYEIIVFNFAKIYAIR